MRRKTKSSTPDSRSIDIEDDYALIFWSKELHVTPAKLKNAVQAVGPIVTDVNRKLKSK